MSHSTTRPARRLRIAALVTAVLLVLVLAGAGAGYLLLRTIGSPRQTAASYLAAWQRGSYASMQKVSVNVPRSGLAGPLMEAAAELGQRRIRLSLGQVTASGGSALARFTAAADLTSGHVWTYRGQLRLVRRDRRWWVSWSPGAIYPGLTSGERFVLHGSWPARAPVLAADGTVLSSPQAISESGSLSLLTGSVVPATAAQAKALGAPYQAGDLIGQGGIEQAYSAQLAGRPALSIRIEGPGRHFDATVARFAATPGTPVRTSIDMQVQLAASQAVRSAATTKPVDLVAIQPSTGRVLAVVERPGGFDRALQGEFPPGSTFKVLTASALAKTGLRPASMVQCPSQIAIGGRTFHNDHNEHYGATSLQTAFAVSCNTTFAMLATNRLGGRALASTAAAFGFNRQPALGIPAILGRFSTPHDPVDLAADAFGQGTDLVNPLSQATVAAAIEDGTWRPPQLVISPAPRQRARPAAVSPAILATLRPMMRAVVTSGTAANVGFPPGVYGKTGTAEYGTGPKPPSHAWFIGYRGDLAFAVLVEGGGLGASNAGPIANAFVRQF
jgi:Penicillin binding protein transpeptidase domain/NTF2-like N-terminal transpeptidase domain